MIPRATVAAALGLPEDTDALPQGDLPPERLAARMLAAMERPEEDETDVWTLDLFHHLVTTAPNHALDTVLAMLEQSPESAAEIGSGPLHHLVTEAGGMVIGRIEGEKSAVLTRAMHEIDPESVEHPFLRARIAAIQG